jgi:hypothetical protein
MLDREINGLAADLEARLGLGHVLRLSSPRRAAPGKCNANTTTSITPFFTRSLPPFQRTQTIVRRKTL